MGFWDWTNDVAKWVGIHGNDGPQPYEPISFPPLSQLPTPPENATPQQLQNWRKQNASQFGESGIFIDDEGNAHTTPSDPSSGGSIFGAAISGAEDAWDGIAGGLSLPSLSSLNSTIQLVAGAAIIGGAIYLLLKLRK
jgi:hypothetical protein